METEGLRKRPVALETATLPKLSADSKAAPKLTWAQKARAAGFVAYFLGATLCLHLQQWLGAPLYLISKPFYYAWQATTKAYFTLLLITMTEYWSPATVHLTWDKNLDGEIVLDKNRRAKLLFPERLVLLSNHQLYTDWVFCWWAAYAAGRQGDIFIVLKETIKYIPLLGPGMMFFSFIFLSRKWESDKPRFQHRLRKLSSPENGIKTLSSPKGLAPMWLLIFPEGTTLCRNGRNASAKWAEKIGIQDTTNVLLPRSRGLQFCLEELKDTVEFIYDCTLIYEGIPEGVYGEDYFTLRSIYVEGKYPTDLHMHWRRFAIHDIPLEEKAFDAWLLARYREKDEMLANWKKTGHFQSFEPDKKVSAKVGPNHALEVVQIFASLLSLPLFWYFYKFVMAIIHFFRG